VKNKEHFIDTIQSNIGIIHKAASLYTSNPQDKEDLTQEIIYQLWKSFDSFKNKSSISTWIYRVAMNVSIYYLKQKKKSLITIPINQETLKVESSMNHEDDDKWKKIHQQIENLNLLEKGIIMLYLEGKSYKDISEIIGISESNVGTKLTRIKSKLKKEFQTNNKNEFRRIKK